MFVSQPEYEFSFPPDLGQPGSQHWRMMELSLDMPWFLVSVDGTDAEKPEFSVTRTLCIAWDYDLADVVRRLDADQVKGIVCMMPACASPSGQWTLRQVSEVWMLSSVAGQSVLLMDVEGQAFDCGLVPDHVGPVSRELVLRAASAGRHARQRTQRGGSVLDSRGHSAWKAGT